MKKDLHHILVHLHFLDAYAQVPHETIQENGDGSVSAIAKFIPILSNYLHLNQKIEFKLTPNHLTVNTLPLDVNLEGWGTMRDLGVFRRIDDWQEPYWLNIGYDAFRTELSDKLKEITLAKQRT